MEMHYNEDLSLGEIAGRAGITRQGVHDGLKRGADTLERCETRLRLLERYLAVKACLDALAGQLAGCTALDEAGTERLRVTLKQAAEIWEGNNGL